MSTKFELGKTVMTVGINDFMTENNVPVEGVIEMLSRHSEGDWGMLSADDWYENDEALREGGRLLSAYSLKGERVWVITESDRSATTVLFPSEY